MLVGGPIVSMNRTAIRKSLIAPFCLAFVVCAARPGAGDSRPARNASEQAARACQTTDSQSSESKPPAGSESRSQKSTAAVDNAKLQAEIVWRDGTVTRDDPTKVNTSSTIRPQAKLICFSDCKGAPRNDSYTDLIVLKNGSRKSGSVENIQETSVELYSDGYEFIPLAETRYIVFSNPDHVASSFREALPAPTRTLRLILHTEPDCRTSDRKREPGFLTDKDGNIHLKHLSAKLGRLTSLKELDIACLEELKDLPPEIGNLRNLEKLVMNNGNGCVMGVALPASIGQLHHLRVLDLYGALGKPLPNTIANLQSLEVLDLGHNFGNVREVPPQIASLHKLRYLGLDWAEIRQLPAFIGNLENLKELWLRSAHGKNHPIELPDSLGRITGLKVFMGNNYLKLKDQERLRKRFPKLVFDFEDEFDSNPDANEARPEPKAGPPSH